MSGLSTEAPRGKTEMPTRWQIDTGDYVTDAAVSHDGALAAVGTGGGEVVVLDLETGAQRWRAAGHSGGVLAVAFSPRELLLATAGQDGRTRLVDADGVELASLPGNGAWVDHLAWSPDGKLLATSSGRVLRLWTSSGEPRLETRAAREHRHGARMAQGRRGARDVLLRRRHLWAVAAARAPPARMEGVAHLARVEPGRQGDRVREPGRVRALLAPGPGRTPR